MSSSMITWSKTLESGTQLFFTGAKNFSPLSPHGSTNLAFHVGDKAHSVEKNREKLAQEIGVATVQFMSQTHGNNFESFVASERLTESQVQNTDALIFSGAGAAAAVMVADCVPVLIADDSLGVYAVVHAGRAGVLNGIVVRVLEEFFTRGATTISVVLGPAICEKCYEIPEQMAQECSVVLSESVAKTRQGTPSFDLKAGLQQAIQQKAKQHPAVKISIDNLDICTLENSDYFSYRKNKAAGRFVGGISVARNA